MMPHSGPIGDYGMPLSVGESVKLLERRKAYYRFQPFEAARWYQRALGSE